MGTFMQWRSNPDIKLVKLWAHFTIAVLTDAMQNNNRGAIVDLRVSRRGRQVDIIHCRLIRLFNPPLPLPGKVIPETNKNISSDNLFHPIPFIQNWTSRLYVLNQIHASLLQSENYHFILIMLVVEWREAHCWFNYWYLEMPRVPHCDKLFEKNQPFFFSFHDKWDR